MCLMPNYSARDTTVRWFRRQHALIHRSQAASAGLTRHQIDRLLCTGEWVRVYRNVYRLAGAPVTWHQRVLAACLATGGVASHRTAAALWGLEGFEPGRVPVEVTVPGTNRRRLRGATVHHTRSLARADRAEVGGVPVTSPPRTLLDLAGAVDGDRLEAALDAALREGLTSVSWLMRWLPAAGRAGAGRLRELALDRLSHQPAGSGRELKAARMLVALGLPRPVRQHELVEGGRVVARFDLAWPHARVAVEFVSWRHHHGRRSWRYDVSRNNRAGGHDWLVFSLTEHDTRDGCRSVGPAIHRAIGLRTAPKLPAA
jgi:hypothetical protein